MKRLAGALDKRWIEKRMGVVPQTVRNWRTGMKVTQARLDDLVAAVREVLPETKETPRPEWAEGLEEQMNGIATRLDAFDEWHRRADELQQDQVVEAATQGAVAAIRTFLDEIGIQIVARPKPDPLPSSSEPQEPSS